MNLKAIRANARKDWYQIRAAASGQPAQVLIYGDIGDSWWDDSVSAAQFVRDLAEIDDADPIDFHIHSPGGDAFDGLAIATAIRSHPAPTVAYVDGLAASAASVIAISADETVMAVGSLLMIHDAWGFAIGNAADMSKMADDLDRVSGNLATLYARKGGGTADEWRDAMRAETWYTADEAVEAKLADRVDEAIDAKDAAAKARFDLSIFNHAGRGDAPAPYIPSRARASKPPAEPAETHPPTEGADMTSDTLISGLRERLGIPAEAALDDNGILAAVDEVLAERAESTPAAVPPGAVLIEESALADLRAAASQGREAREQQLSDRRASLVSAAIGDGRIPPARRDHWLAALKTDSGMEQVLESLAPGLIPVEAKGYTGGVTESSDDDRIYAAAFGKEA